MLVFLFFYFKTEDGRDSGTSSVQKEELDEILLDIW